MTHVLVPKELFGHKVSHLELSSRIEREINLIEISQSMKMFRKSSSCAVKGS